MGRLQRFRDWFLVTEAANYVQNFSDESESETPAPAGPIDAMFAEMYHSELKVGRSEALSVPAVLRGRNLICAISTLPLVQYGPDRKVIDNPLFRQIDTDIPNVTTLSQTVEDLLFEGISWWEITAFAFDDFPMAAKHRDFSSVSLQPPATGGSASPLPGGYDPRGATVYVDGRPVPWSNMIRFDSPNPGLLKAAGRPIKRAILLDKAAGTYADDPRPLDYFTPKEGADPLDDDGVKDFLGRWKAARKRRSTGYVPAAVEYNSVDVMSPRDLQLAELQKQVTLEIANAMGLDPEDMGASMTSRTYQNATDRRQDRINDTLSPYMRAITDRLSMGDVTKRGHTVRFDLDDYLRADPRTRSDVQKTYVDMGVITVDEVRAEEGYAGKAPGKPKAEPVAAPLPVKAQAHERASMTFDGDNSLTFADLPMTTFTVDPVKRTITGRAVPYGVGETAQKAFRKYRFAPGSLEWSDVKRVKLLREHDYAQGLGRAVTLTEAEGGLDVVFSVARGAARDEALALAEDGVLDGLSVGVDILDAVPDPENKGVTLIKRAALREVSLTAFPSFDNARLTSVNASRTDKGDTQMSDNEPTTAPSVPAPAPDLNAMFAAFLTSQQTPVAPVVPEQRQVVNPTRLTASVTDPAPYVFDRSGNLRKGTHEFSSDLFAAGRGDQSAYERAMAFVTEQFVITTDVDELNPTRQRPDMYVDQRKFKYPVWESISKGTLADITPFTFPKFSSAGTLVAAHVEGTEPSLGTFVTTNQTVNPSAVSGKMKITREVYDQGGNPQVTNLIWQKMVQAWYEALEASAVALLDAATPTGITLTTGGGTTGQTLDSELTAAFAALQYVRGGFTMDTMFAQIDLYKALVAAKDTTGRRLYPAIGPSNASGTVRSRFATLDINGVEALPAWALASTGVVAASSYLFDRADVHGWATIPQRLEINTTEVANVYLGLWGYKATAISDINGVRELIYDPA